MFQSGPMQILGVYRQELFCETYPITVSFTLPEERSIYSMRSGKFLGTGASFTSSFFGGDVDFFAMLPYEVKAIQAEVPTQAHRGQMLEGIIKLQISKGAAGPHVIFVQVKGPDGALRPYFEQKLVLSNGQAPLRLPIAWNEPPGTYTLLVRDVASGTQAQAKWEVR